MMGMSIFFGVGKQNPYNPCTPQLDKIYHQRAYNTFAQAEVALNLR
jgi:hypothetical protein